MDAVHIVSGHDFFGYPCQIVGCSRISGVEIPASVEELAESGLLFHHAVLVQAYLAFVSYRDADNPGVKFQPSFVAFFNGKPERVVSRILFRMSGQAFGKRLYLRRINHVPSQPRLEEHGVEVRFLQRVQPGRKFRFLRSGCGCGHGLLARPVHPSQGGQPYGSDFVFGLRGEGCRMQAHECRQQGEQASSQCRDSDIPSVVAVFSFHVRIVYALDQQRYKVFCIFIVSDSFCDFSDNSYFCFRLVEEL